MNGFSFVSALPWMVLAPIAVGCLIPLGVRVLQRSRSRAGVALRLADVVARQGSVGLAVLVAGTAIVVFRVGLSQLAMPAEAELAATAADVERVRAVTNNDLPSLSERLRLIGAQDPRVAWALLARTTPCDGVTCLYAADQRLREGAASALASRNASRSLDRSAVREGATVAMIVSAPVRDASGRPDLALLIGFDGEGVARQAAASAWAVLLFASLLGALIVRGTKTAVSRSVVERLDGLAGALLRAPAGTTPVAETPSDGDELQALARAVDVAAERHERRDAQFRMLVEQAPVGIVRLDAKGSIVAANPRFLALLGIESARGMPSWDTVFAQPEQAARLQQALAKGEAIAGERWNWRRSDGTDRLVRVSLVPLPPSADAPGAELLVEDVSEQQALEAQLLRAQKMEMVGRLVGGIAHDFNNLLTIVRGSVIAMGGTAASPDLGAIDDAAARGARLVRRLLTIGRADAIELVVQPVGPLLHDAIATVRRLLPARIQVVGPTEIPERLVALDRDAIDQALLNLALNALDAIEGDGTLCFAVSATDGAPRGLAISCTDSGTGMSADVLLRATEPFFTTKAPDAGSGLGLAVVYAIMARHGGRLELRSTEGEGTVATLWFPLATTPVLPPARPDTPPETLKAMGGLHILVVDDEHAVRRLTGRVLQRAGCTVASAASAAEADALLAADHAFDVVVCDVMMPGGTGPELLEMVRARGDQVPFLFVSGYTVETLEGTIGNDGNAHLLSKPWTGNDLLTHVHQASRR